METRRSLPGKRETKAKEPITQERKHVLFYTPNFLPATALCHAQLNYRRAKDDERKRERHRRATRGLKDETGNGLARLETRGSRA